MIGNLFYHTLLIESCNFRRTWPNGKKLSPTTTKNWAGLTSSSQKTTSSFALHSDSPSCISAWRLRISERFRIWQSRAFQKLTNSTRFEKFWKVNSVKMTDISSHWYYRKIVIQTFESISHVLCLFRLENVLMRSSLVCCTDLKGMMNDLNL